MNGEKITLNELENSNMNIMWNGKEYFVGFTNRSIALESVETGEVTKLSRETAQKYLHNHDMPFNTTI